MRTATADEPPAPPPPATPAVERITPRELGVLLVVLVLVAGLHLACARGDLWLDEVWSVLIAAEAKTPLEVYTHYAVDNNHILNTLYLRAVGDAPEPFAARGLALVSGATVPALAWLILRRRERLAAWVAVWLVAGSYLLTLYSSEARGYAPALAFSLAAWYLIARYVERPAWGITVLYWLVTVLGLLSHLTFVFALAGTVSWSAWFLLRRDGARGIPAFLMAQIVPSAAALMLYVTFVRRMEIGGGHAAAWTAIVPAALSTLLGGPDSGWRVAAMAGLAGALLVVGWVWCWKERAGEAVLYIVTLVLAPAIVTLQSGLPFLHIRHFIVCVPFALLLMSRPIAVGLRRGGVPRILCVLGLAAYTAANGRYIADLLCNQRGQYRAALAHMAARTPEPALAVTGDHDFRDGMLVIYYSRSPIAGHSVRYLPQEEAVRDPPPWFIVQHLAATEPVRDALSFAGRRYDFDGRFPAAYLAGITWDLYRRAAPPQTGP